MRRKTMSMQKAVATETAPPGPVSIFRRKVRKPVTLTLTPEHHVMVNRAMRRLKLSRADVIALLIDQYADTIEQ
jgi:hypothetical protein